MGKRKNHVNKYDKASQQQAFYKSTEAHSAKQSEIDFQIESRLGQTEFTGVQKLLFISLIAAGFLPSCAQASHSGQKNSRKWRIRVEAITID